MIAKPSPLQLTDFQLLNLQYRFVNPTDTDEINTDDLFGQYGIEVDFAIKRQDDTDFTIFTKADINSEGIQPGYVLFVEGVSSFHIAEPSMLPEAKLQNLLVFSGVGIAMQQLRSRIADLTSFAPFGKYMIPTLDMDDLLQQKQEKKEPTGVFQKGKAKSQSNRVLKTERALPGIRDFRVLISQKLQAVQEQNNSFIDLNAGELHREAGGGTGNNIRVASCVSAMRQAMQEGDEVLTEPPGGAGSSVTIRYRLPR